MSATSFRTGPPLSWPDYDVSFIDAVRRGLAKYATFSGRASRREYWWWQVFLASSWFAANLLFLALSKLTSAGGHDSDYDSTRSPVVTAFLVVVILVYLALVIPSLALTVRRLHDTGRSGLTYLVGLIPFVGGLILLGFLGSRTSPLAGRYGPPVIGGVAAVTTAEAAAWGSPALVSPAYGSALGASAATGSAAYASATPKRPTGAVPASALLGDSGSGAGVDRRTGVGTKAVVAIVAAAIVLVVVSIVTVSNLGRASAGADTSTGWGDGGAVSDGGPGSSGPGASGDGSSAGDDPQGSGNGDGSGYGNSTDDGSVDGSGDDTGSTTEPSPPEVVGTKPDKATACPSTYSLDHTPSYSAVNAKTTTCGFAEEVRKAYVESGQEGQDVTLTDVYSPKLGSYFSMSCSGTDTVVCTGGVKAKVYLY